LTLFETNGQVKKGLTLDNVHLDIFKLKTKTSSIPAFLFTSSKNDNNNEYVILFSHGNATDLGEMHDILLTTCYTL